MKGIAALLVSLAVALVWTGAAVAGDPPGCNGTIFLSSEAGDTPGTEPKFTRGDTIHVNGTGFDAGQAFTGYTVDDVNDGTNVITSTDPWNADESGNFTFSFSTDQAGFEDAHEYKVTVYFTKEVGNQECQKSKNFFLEEEEQPGGTTTTTGGVSGGTTGGTTGGVGGAGAGGELPFTGLPVWIPAVAAAALLASGFLLLRRRGREFG
jgi:hypothetical protein